MSSNNKQLRVSLVIPLKNESDTLAELVRSIEGQTLAPAEILLVDGGSTDNTVEQLKRLVGEDDRFRIIEAGPATPGRGRNTGIENARNEWIALTDAGIKLENEWLENLAETAKNTPGADLIYGNFAPVTGSLFEKCAALAYVPAARAGAIRGRSVASVLLKKKVWSAVGGFPDRRAAEDLMFMEAAAKAGFKCAFAPGARVYWKLRPDLLSTFQKFTLYSKHNVWAGRAWDWHYGILRQYLVLLPVLALAVFHSPWWLCGVAAWLGARAAKRILAHRFEFGIAPLFNPLIFFGVAALILTIDLATFTGWAQAVLNKTEN